ncbi:MAG: hypothetical protein HW405_743 [Candidatus Berkelbacteria bacterium]|nr:hypothetical protein [Candidatus Berkelbacteria bacterium]
MFVYGLFGLWILLIWAISGWTTPLQEFITLLGLFFIPGFALKRIFKIHLTDDRLGNILVTLTLGFIFNTTIAFLGLFANMTINVLVGTYIGLGLLSYIIALVGDILKPQEYLLLEMENIGNTLKNFFKNPFNLIYIVMILVGLAVLATVSQLGANFTGDPMDHLSIMRKIYDGQPISIENIAWIKNEFYPVYIFSPWHIFLTIATKITHSDIFNFWRDSPLALSVLAMLVWFWLWLKVLPKKELVPLAWFLTVFYIFQQNGYLFTRMTVPDSFASLLLFPLVFGMTMKYMFNKENNFKLLIVLSLLIAGMGVVHWTQYFYFLLVMGLFGIIYAIIKYKDPDYKQILERIAFATLANLALIGPILLYIQYKGNTITKTVEIFATIKSTFKNDRFYKFQVYYKITYLLLPLMFLFIRKYRRLIFILAVFLIGPLVFNIPGVQEFLYRTLSHVFVKRFYASVEWPFVIWAIFLGFLLLLIDKIILKLEKISKSFRYTIDSILALLAILMLWLQSSRESITGLYDKIFSENNRLWINDRYYWLFAMIIAVSIGLYIWQKYNPKLVEFFTFTDCKDKLALVLATFILVFFFSAPSLGHFTTYSAKALSNGKLTAPISDISNLVIDYDKFGGQETIDFIKTRISPKAVFDSTDANYVLPMLVDVHMASQSYGSDPTKKYEAIYDPTITASERMSLINQGQIEYILFLRDTCESANPFNSDPANFTLTYHSCTADIYQINK